MVRPRRRHSIAAVLLWDVMFRSNIGVSISFLEEMWSRNLGQLFASPLRPYEWAMSLLAISAIRTLIGIVPAAFLAIPLYQYSVFEMGLPLIAFFVNLLIFGAAVGLAVSGLVLRCGLGAESLAWAVIFAVAPQAVFTINRDSSGLAAAGCLRAAVGTCV